MEEGNNRSYGFGEFRVDARRRVLSKNGETISLTPRNFDLLLVMIENEGRILSHDDLLDKVWEGTFVEQSNLKNAVSVLRKVLGEEPNEGAYIRTIPRRGYSFVAPVQLLPDNHKPTAFSYEETAQEVIVEESWEIDNDEPVVESKVIKPSATAAGRRAQKISRGKIIFLVVAILLAIAGGFGIRAYFFGTGWIIYDANAVTISRITSEGNLVGGNASIAPNGKYLVYSIRDGDNVSLWTRQITTGIARQISNIMRGSVWACLLTPDEDFIYFTFNDATDASKSGLYKISTFGGSAQKVSENRGGSIAVSPDGKRLALVRTTAEPSTHVDTINLDGSDVKTLWTSTDDVRIWNVKYSPDGTTILLSVRRQLPGKAVYYIGEVPVDGGAEKIILPEQEKQIADAIWLPDKQSLLMSVREMNAELRQIWQYFPASGEWKRVTNDNASYRGISLTRDGKTLVASQESRLSTLWASPTGVAEDLTQVMPGTHYLVDVGWTGDSRIVFSGVENSKELIGLMNSDGSGKRFLTNGDDGIWLFPAPSRDGRQIAHVSNRSGRKQLWAMDYDGRSRTQLTHFETDIYDGWLLADGKTSIALHLLTPQKTNLVMRQADGHVRTLVEDQSNSWAISPDEKLIAVQTQNQKTQKPEVNILSIETGEVVKRLDVSIKRILKWTANGKALAYDAKDGDSVKIMIQPIDGGSAKGFLTLRSEDIFSFDWSADGNRFALIRGKHLTDAVKITIGPDR
jgi:DNA-binding winged helix-turn-helix (wHTH) protein/Tol biopolymer transport system component